MLKKRVEGIVHGATDAVAGAIDARVNAVTVRPDADSLQRIDELVEAEVFPDRTAAAAFLVGEGIKANAAMEELRSLRGDAGEGGEPSEPTEA